MSEFTQNITNPFPDNNMLFDASKVAAAGQAYQGNQLLMQGRQLDLSNAEGEQVGRAAAGLLSLGDEASRAAAYPRVVGMLQSQNLAKNAPATYPGEAALRALVSQSVPVPDQIRMGLYTPPGTTAAINAALMPGGGATSGTGAAAAPGTSAASSGPIEPSAQARATLVRDGLIKRGMDPETATAFAANALHESAANPSTGPGDGGVSQGLFMWNGPRNTEYQRIYGHTPQGAPLDEQLDFVMHELNGPESLARDRINQAQGVDGKAAQVSEAYLRPKDTGPEMQRRSATALQLQRQLGGGTQTAIAPGGGGGAAAPASTQFAGPGAPPGSTAAPGAPTVAAPVDGATTAAAPPAATPGVAQPAPTASLPHAANVPTGTSSPQYQQAMDLQRRAMVLDAQPDPTGRLKTLAAGLRSQAALILQTDSVVNTQEGQLHTMTGKLDDPAKPLADYHETSPGSGIWVGGPGTEPRFQPPGRLVVGPDGTVWQTSTSGAHVLQPADPAAIAARKAAEAQGTGVGKDVAAQVPKLAEQGRSATQAIGNIDYGMNQLREASKAGIPTGYFSQWLATGAAAAKSLGIDLSALGVDPAAVGNIQSAQKTLGVVAGAILQQAIGKDSQITDAKIEHFIHTQPGIETDPKAIERVLNWARSQFVYEHEMSKAAMDEAAGSPTGTLPLNWQARYFKDKGFAPIYNPGTGEMQQPEGQGPSRSPPASFPTAPVNPAAREANKTYSTPRGPLKWTGTGWLPVQ